MLSSCLNALQELCSHVTFNKYKISRPASRYIGRPTALWSSDLRLIFSDSYLSWPLIDTGKKWYRWVHERIIRMYILRKRTSGHRSHHLHLNKVPSNAWLSDLQAINLIGTFPGKYCIMPPRCAKPQQPTINISKNAWTVLLFRCCCKCIY